MTSSRVHVLLGGTGTLGQALCRALLTTTSDRIRILARGEHRLMEMQRRLDAHGSRLSFFVGDIRDRMRLRRALTSATHVYHLAALKHVHTCEYDVLEAVHTNVTGTANVVEACIDAGVTRAVLVSTDKAVEPTTTYGATKMCAEKLFIHGNSYAPHGCEFYCVRYGNVLGSQGSVVQIWKHQANTGSPITIANPDTTRFWWTIGDAAHFVYQSMFHAHAGDVLVPLMNACSLSQLADIVAPNTRQKYIDSYSTEKTHEILLASHETANATYVNGLNAVRVSYLRSPSSDERQWCGRQLASSEHIYVDGVRESVKHV